MLFDRRVDLYKKSKGLYLLWEKNKSHLLDHDKNKIFGANDLFFMWLTNNGFLYKVGPVINTMLSDNENHERFLLKLEEIEGLSKEIKFAFSRSEKNDISLFVHFMVNYWV